MKKLTFLILFISLFSFKAQAQFGSGNHPPEIDSDNIIKILSLIPAGLILQYIILVDLQI